MKISALLLLLFTLTLGMMGCDSYQPQSGLSYTHWTPNLRSSTLARYSLVCNKNGKIVGSIDEGYAWYATSSDTRLNAEYQSAEDARSAIENFSDREKMCEKGVQ